MYIKRQKQNKQTKNKTKKTKNKPLSQKIAPSFTLWILFLNIGNLESRTNRTKNRRWMVLWKALDRYRNFSYLLNSYDSYNIRKFHQRQDKYNIFISYDFKLNISYLLLLLFYRGLWCLTPLSTIFQLYHGWLFLQNRN